MSKDPLVWCGDLAWYLCERDSALGVRSSWDPLVSIAQGATPSGESSSDRWVHLTSSHHAMFGTRSPIARDRIMRPIWAALSSYERDLLSVHYTGRCIVGVHPDDGGTGFARFPRGFEAGLGIFAGVALHLATLAGIRGSIILAGESSGPIKALETFRASAEAAVKEAHQTYYDLVALTGPEPDDDEPKRMSDWEIMEEMAEITGHYSAHPVQREGRWVQR